MPDMPPRTRTLLRDVAAGFAALVLGAPLVGVVVARIALAINPPSSRCGQVGCWDSVFAGAIGGLIAGVLCPAIVVVLLRRADRR